MLELASAPLILFLSSGLGGWLLQRFIPRRRLVRVGVVWTLSLWCLLVTLDSHISAKEPCMLPIRAAILGMLFSPLVAYYYPRARLAADFSDPGPIGSLERAGCIGGAE